MIGDSQAFLVQDADELAIEERWQMPGHTCMAQATLLQVCTGQLDLVWSWGDVM